MDNKLEFNLKKIADMIVEAKEKKLAITLFWDPIRNELKVVKQPVDKVPGLKQLMGRNG